MADTDRRRSPRRSPFRRPRPPRSPPRSAARHPGTTTIPSPPRRWRRSSATPDLDDVFSSAADALPGNSTGVGDLPQPPPEAPEEEALPDPFVAGGIQVPETMDDGDMLGEEEVVSVAFEDSGPTTTTPSVDVDEDDADIKREPTRFATIPVPTQAPQATTQPDPPAQTYARKSQPTPRGIPTPRSRRSARRATAARR